jgi:5-methylcytosine-specific restriction protein A
MQREWRAVRARHLQANPFCVKCLFSGTQTKGTTVDHKIPHRGLLRLMFDPKNLQTLCTPHHSASKQREEIVGYSTACDSSGAPLDPRHPWNAKSGLLQGASLGTRAFEGSLADAAAQVIAPKMRARLVTKL